jgi:carboxylesterase type B
MFYIHGGAFQTDNAQLLGDENILRYLNSKDVIVVTFNYRLQFFGFLAIDENTPGKFTKTKQNIVFILGNSGLWDMALALEWTRDNIKAFGGDPKKITVSGQSAGSMATDLFTISPHTRGKFIISLKLANYHV